jgi:hypothetical protein
MVRCFSADHLGECIKLYLVATVNNSHYQAWHTLCKQL